MVSKAYLGLAAIALLGASDNTSRSAYKTEINYQQPKDDFEYQRVRLVYGVDPKTSGPTPGRLAAPGKPLDEKLVEMTRTDLQNRRSFVRESGIHNGKYADLVAQAYNGQEYNADMSQRQWDSMVIAVMPDEKFNSNDIPEKQRKHVYIARLKDGKLEISGVGDK